MTYTSFEGFSLSETRFEERRGPPATPEMMDFTVPKGVEINTSQITDLFEMRLLLETSALRHALGKHTDVDFAKAEIALDMAATEVDPRKLEALNWEFHSALYRPCRRQTLLRTIEQFNKASAFTEIVALSIGVRLQASIDEHRELLQACRDGDETDAVSVLDRHLTLACEDLSDVM